MGLLASGNGGAVAGLLPDGPPPTTALLTRDSVEGGLDTPAYALLAAAIHAMVASSMLSLLTRWNGQLTAARSPWTPRAPLPT